MVTYRVVAPDGRLADTLRPAIYLDGSVIIDYYSVEGVESVAPAEREPSSPRDTPEQLVVADLLKADKRIAKMSELRRLYLSQEEGPCLVSSPIALLELIEWHADVVFKQFAAETSGANAVQRLGKKALGRLLQELLHRRQDEHERLGPDSKGRTALSHTVQDTWISASFAHTHGLSGVVIADLIDFRVTEGFAYGPGSYFAYVQLGAADILHLLAASHLGCEFIASFDSDFRRVKRQIKDELQMEVLTRPEEILSVIRSGRAV